MRRIATAALLVVVASLAPAAPATADPHRGARVRGGFRGEVSFHPNQSGCIAVTVHDGFVRARVLGHGKYHIDACAYSDGGGVRVVGLMTITTRGSQTLEGTIDQPLGGTDVTVTVTGGSGRFEGATGKLVLHVETFDFRNCDGRTGICFDWSERGTLTGCLRFVT